MPNDLHIANTSPLVNPKQLAEEIPLTAKAAATVERGRGAVRRIMHGQDHKLVVVVGPCSIHDVSAANDYAKRLAPFAEKYRDRMVIVMRTYFEKPRTTIGWRGLLNDPHLDGSDDTEEGLRRARRLLIDVNELGLPTATEMLDPIVPQYIAELVAVDAVGARNIESQSHRALASGLSMPVAYKNGTGGNLKTVGDAMIAGQHKSSFIGINLDGYVRVHHTTGNPDGMLVLRGGNGITNFDAQSILQASNEMRSRDLLDRVMVDCSHANSNGDPVKQAWVWRYLLDNLPTTRGKLIGLMVESFIEEGKQSIVAGQKDLQYGLSVTDACMGWEQTAELLAATYEALG